MAATAIETPDIIITDLEMPVADGAFVVRTLRGKPESGKASHSGFLLTRQRGERKEGAQHRS
ncbi:MAG: hypothetical protein LRY51_03205 [Geovibrio sp.]|nr:hypothetical protein [Geovibrio sp.]